jgi:hypothetical protein
MFEDIDIGKRLTGIKNPAVTGSKSFFQLLILPSDLIGIIDIHRGAVLIGNPAVVRRSGKGTWCEDKLREIILNFGSGDWEIAGQPIVNLQYYSGCCSSSVSPGWPSSSAFTYEFTVFINGNVRHIMPAVVLLLPALQLRAWSVKSSGLMIVPSTIWSANTSLILGRSAAVLMPK